jgi:hypothetical protein
MKLYALLLPLLLLLPACGTFGNLSATIGEARELVTKVNETVEIVKPEIEKIVKLVDELSEMGDALKGDLGEAVGEFKDLNDKAKAEADKDGDGELSWSEWIAYLLAGGGGGIVLIRKYLERLKKTIVAEAVKAGADEAVKP